MSRPFTRRAFIASLACATSAAAASVMTACSKTGKGASAEQTVAFPDVIPLREGQEEAAYNSALLQQAIDDASKKSGSVHSGNLLGYAALCLSSRRCAERSIAGARTFRRGNQVEHSFEAFFPRRGESRPRLGLRARDCHQSGSGRPESELYARQDDGHAASAR